jgi:hypothetical protein
MKQLFTLTVVILALGMNAQTVISYDQVATTTVVFNMYDITKGAFWPTDGVDQVWDYSAAPVQHLGTQAITMAGGTPFAADYPSSNWAWMRSYLSGADTEYDYLIVSTDGIEVEAAQIPVAPLIYSVDPRKLMHFPFDYGQSFSDTETGNGVTSSFIWTYTGHGTAITPFGTVNNIAKLSNNAGAYILWHTNPVHPLLVNFAQYATLFVAPSVGVPEQGMDVVSVYPNPCQDRLTISGSEALIWTLLDMQGRLLKNGRLTVAGPRTIDLSGIAVGSYALVLNGNRSRQVERICVER